MEKSIENIGDALERKVRLIRDSRYTTLYFTAVADYHTYICNSSELTPILKELISEEKIMPAQLEEIFNDFLISQNLRFDIPKNIKYPNFYSEKIENRYGLLKKFIEFIEREREAIRLSERAFYTPKDHPAVKVERDEEFFYNQKLHNDIIEKLTEWRGTQKPNKYLLSFDDEKRLIHFMNEEIVIGKKEESDPHKLIRTLFKDVNKVWANDEIREDWGYAFDEKTPKDKIYKASITVNKIVAQDTKIKDFLIYSTKTVSINKEYLI